MPSATMEPEPLSLSAYPSTRNTAEIDGDGLGISDHVGESVAVRH